MATRTNKTKNASKKSEVKKFFPNTPEDYREFLEKCYDVISSSRFTFSEDCDEVETDGKAIRINISELLVPGFGTVGVMALTVIRDHKKCIALEPGDYSDTCSKIENMLLDASPYVDCEKSIPYWISLKEFLPNSWYDMLHCHRLFFFPKEFLLDVVVEFMNEDNFEILRLSSKVEEVVYCTDVHLNFKHRYTKRAGLINLSDIQ